jgi:branched-chain amino acid transport system substrate-binding protein
MKKTHHREISSDAAAGLSRRQVLLSAGAASLALAGGARAFAAGAENVVKVGFISPRTGALGGFGQTDGYVLDVARKALASGLSVGGKTYEVNILDQDTQSDPSRAGQLAKALINSDQVDLMLAVSTPETINPVADACEAAAVPCLSTVMPWEAWYFGRGAKPGAPSPFKWTYHFGFGTEEFHKMYISQWSLLPTNKKVAVLYPNDADGNAIREHLAPLLAKDGYTIVDAGPYEDGTTDYSAQIALFKKEKCEIFNSFPIPPDFAAFWRQAAQQGYTKMVKICQVAKTGLFPDGVEALGALGFNQARAYPL